jgi:hypothetical protein
MVSTTSPSTNTSPIEKLPIELLEGILLEVTKHTVPPVLEEEDPLSILYRCHLDKELACSLAFRLTSRGFRDCAWKAFGAYLGETVFDLRSRQSISNLTAASTCRNLAPWVTKLIVACDGIPERYPILRRSDLPLMTEAEWNHESQNIDSDLLRIRQADESWYPSIWKSPMMSRGIAITASREAERMEIQDILATALRCFSNIYHMRFYHESYSPPGRYHNFFKKINVNSPCSYSRHDSVCGAVAHIGLEILIHAMAASNTNVRTMTLAVDLDDHHAFPTNTSPDIFAKVSHQIETLVLQDKYFQLRDEDVHDETSLSVTKDFFPKLKWLIVDHGLYTDWINDRPTTSLPSSSNTPVPTKLTVKNTEMTGEAFLSFLQCYGQHAQCITLESLTDADYRPVLESVRNLHIETLEIHNRYSESYWKSSKDHEAESSLAYDVLDMLEELPQDLVQQAAKTVKLYPPSFKDALERHWLENPKGLSDTDDWTYVG